MASSINPNNIDGNYPVAGQDNDSQGFRDNFTNIKNNLTFSKSEIEDLQSKAILSSALTGGSTPTNDMNGTVLLGAQLQNTTLKKAEFTASTGSVTVNYNLGHVHYVTTTGSISLAIANWPSSSDGYGSMFLEVTPGSTAHTLTLPAAVSVGLNKIPGVSGQIITFPVASVPYLLELVSYDGGTTIKIINHSADVYDASSEDVADAAAISLSVKHSYFTTAAAETATLAAGIDGQVKYLSMAGDSGDMVVTVTNAGWKASGTGTITFDDIGDGCTLKYTNSKWYCVGNNGTTMA